ncbi:MAG TPA: hypothetical protein VJC15_03830 [Candidatus Paceibacterota bacterium]
MDMKDPKFLRAVRRNFNDGLANVAAQATHLPTTHPLTKAYAYLEASASVRFDALVQEFIGLVISGMAEHYQADPMGSFSRPGKKALTPELADKLIDETIAAFREGQAFTGSENLPLLRELPPVAKLAFAQAAYGLLRSEQEILEEATKRVKAGEILPPQAVLDA